MVQPPVAALTLMGEHFVRSVNSDGVNFFLILRTDSNNDTPADKMLLVVCRPQSQRPSDIICLV
jgi:hypothetical protein